MTRFSVLEHPCPVLEHRFLFKKIVFPFQNVLFYSVPFCPVSCPGFWLSRPVPSQILAVPARSLVKFLACPIVPLSWDKEETLVLCPEKLDCPVPLETPICLNPNKHQGRILTSEFFARMFVITGASFFRWQIL